MVGASVKRHQLEIALLVASSLRVCSALALCGDHGAPAAAVGLLALACLSIMAEQWRGPEGRVSTPYAVRRAESDGITEGTLAVPFLLAALVAVNPGGGWMPWLVACSAAAVATLWHIHNQAAVAAGVKTTRQCAPVKTCSTTALAGSGAPTGATSCTSFWALLACGAALICAVWVQACQTFALHSGRGNSGQSSSSSSSSSSDYSHNSWYPNSSALAGQVLLMGAAAPVTFQALMTVLPNTMSLGECGLLTQGVLLALFSGAMSLPRLADLFTEAAAATGSGLFSNVSPSAPPDTRLVPFIQLLVACTVCGTGTAWVWAKSACGAPWVRTASRVAAVVGGVAVALLAAVLAVWTLAVFVPASPHRVWILAYWLAVLAASLPAMRLAAVCKAAPQIILRKGYHLIAAALFLPPFFYDFPLLAVSVAIALAALVAAEVARCTHAPVLGRAIQNFMQDFVDDRDAGPVYITHFTLLLGLALPMWLAATLPCSGELGGADSTPMLASGSNCPGQLRAVLAGLSGLMVIGFGDTAASMVGRMFGHIPIYAGSHKTVEGTVAGAVTTLAGWAAVLKAAGLWVPPSVRVRLAAATAGACLLEACTSQLDNILIPLWYLPHTLLAAP